jgi:ABC-type uncharacterized transport system substrate-binding protein
LLKWVFGCYLVTPFGDDFIGDLMRSLMIRLALALALLVALAAAPAGAHPHVWIDGRADFVFNSAGRLTALGIRWAFDDLYSAFTVQGLDKNRDGKVDANELAPMVANMLKNLKAYDHFTVLHVDGQPAAFAAPIDVSAAYDKGIFTLRFTLPLAEAVDPYRSDVSFAMYDPSFYVAIEVADDRSLTLAGSAPADCAGRIKETTREVESKSLSEVVFQDATFAGSIAAAYARWVAISCGKR